MNADASSSSLHRLFSEVRNYFSIFVIKWLEVGTSRPVRGRASSNQSMRTGKFDEGVSNGRMEAWKI